MAVDLGMGSIMPVLSQAITWIFIISLVAIVSAGAGFLGLMLYRLARYNIKVLVFDHVGERSHVVSADSAHGGTDKNGVNKLSLLKAKVSLPFPDANRIYIYGRNKLLLLHKYGNELAPFNPMSESSPAELSFNYNDLEPLHVWRALSRQKHIESYRDSISTWERWAPYVTPVLMMVIMFVLFFVLFQKLGDLTIQVDASQLVPV